MLVTTSEKWTAPKTDLGRLLETKLPSKTCWAIDLLPIRKPSEGSMRNRRGEEEGQRIPQENKIKPQALCRQPGRSLPSALPHRHLPFWLSNFLFPCFFHWPSLITLRTHPPRLWKRQEMNPSSLGGWPVTVRSEEPPVMRIKTQVQIPSMFPAAGRGGAVVSGVTHRSAAALDGWDD